MQAGQPQQGIVPHLCTLHMGPPARAEEEDPIHSEKAPTGLNYLPVLWLK